MFFLGNIEHAIEHAHRQLYVHQAHVRLRTDRFGQTEAMAAVGLDDAHGNLRIFGGGFQQRQAPGTETGDIVIGLRQSGSMHFDSFRLFEAILEGLHNEDFARIGCHRLYFLLGLHHPVDQGIAARSSSRRSSITCGDDVAFVLVLGVEVDPVVGEPQPEKGEQHRGGMPGMLLHPGTKTFDP